MNSPTRQPPATSPFPAPDRDAFARAYGEHHAALLRYCRSITRHDQDAQDALQSAVTKAWSAWQRGPAVREVRPWLFRIAHNEAITLLRGRRGVEPMAEVPEVESESLAGLVERRERLAHLDADLAALPEKQRAALVLRELNGLGHDEIAAVLDSSPRAVKQTIYEARLALAEAEEGRAMSCSSIQRAISDGDGRVRRGRRLRSHLRGCPRCKAFAAAMERRPGDLAVLAPLPAVGAAALLAEAGVGAGSAALAGAVAAGTGAVGSGAAAGLGAAAAGTGSVAVGTGAVATVKGAVATVLAVAAATGGGVAVERELSGDAPAPRPAAQEQTAPAQPVPAPARTVPAIAAGIAAPALPASSAPRSTRAGRAAAAKERAAARGIRARERRLAAAAERDAKGRRGAAPETPSSSKGRPKGKPAATPARSTAPGARRPARTTAVRKPKGGPVAPARKPIIPRERAKAPKTTPAASTPPPQPAPRKPAKGQAEVAPAPTGATGP